MKGHATADDIKEGRSTEADKEGNDRSDKNADKWVEMVGGKGLTTLGAWVAKRHDRYKKWMERVQKMIAVITLAEKTRGLKTNKCRRQYWGTIRRYGWKQTSRSGTRCKKGRHIKNLN